MVGGIRAVLGLTALVLATAIVSGCQESSPVVAVDTEVAGMRLEGLWGGAEIDDGKMRVVCLKMVEPDSAAALEVTEADTLTGNGSIMRGGGAWSYRDPHVRIELAQWPDARGIPWIQGEINRSGEMLVLRVDYRQGDQFALELQRLSRCGRLQV